ncbi:guanine nucleotide exchange factor VAV2-like isoform X2 [Lytechinus variegatus]|uniref:guanine nucleotide exchange factor VAV2-like isoform X2 n=1 Tax=Lytechinus variegatus TaxID=7654 RepID=UPI001BB1D4B4|nr:guanine nucleotide exchange factor VAV2-like isoform X2 [Lytechinus variegatus]
MAVQSWRLCARWLVECGVLPYDHRIMNQDAEVFDLGQTLRDGVILCHLLNHIKPGSIDTLELSNIRSQTSQFLCMKNIRTFLRACSRVFKIREADFFDPAWLFQMSNFGMLIDLLSKLSNTDDAIRMGAEPFKTEQEDIYGGLEDLADEHDLANEGDIYDTVDEDEGDKIYDDLVNIRRELTSQRAQRQSEPKSAKRDFCRTEIVETEGKYVEALSMLCEQFIRPLKKCLERSEIDRIFLNIEELLRRHKGFLRDLEDAYRRSSPTMAQAFKKHKPDFLIYGFYCAHMLEAQNYIEKVSNNPTVRARIEECERRANDRKFRLRDLLSVPMQRILKYHLLLKELVKSTDKTHQERKELDEALDEMQDVSMYVNEVKRDHELMQYNETIQASLVGYRGESLNTYGRNQKDGDLKIRITGAKKNTSQTRYCFLFDKVMLVCKSGGRLNVEKLWGQESHEYIETIDLAQYNLENNLPSGKGGRWNYCFHLTAKDQSGGRSNLEVACKTDVEMMRWVDGIKLAQENILPRHTKGHTVEYTSFKESTTCDSCHKLLRGLFFQGYKCTTCSITVHKECLTSNQTSYCNQQGNAKPSPMPTGHQLRVTRSYKGVPMPPNGEQPLIVSSGSQVMVLENIGSEWKRVKSLSPPNAIGLVPTQYLMENYEPTSVVRPPMQINREPQPQQQQRAPETTADLFQFPWYVGEMERTEANDKLISKPGCFLLRKSRRGYAVSLEHDRQVKHMRVVMENNQFGLAEQTTFPSLQDMINYYSRNSLVSVFRGLDACLRKPYRGGTMPTENAATNVEARPAQGVRKQRYQVIGHARALYDFSARDTRELSLKENEVVAIVSKAGGHKGWWKGCIGDRVGYFPSTFVDEITDGAPS